MYETIVMDLIILWAVVCFASVAYFMWGAHKEIEGRRK